MATVMPALSSCVSRMTQGEPRTAERLEQKLDDDYLVWYDVPVGPKHAHPDFVVLHPRRGLLILEVKDWRLETIRTASKQTWEILAQGIPKSVPNPIEQARHCAHQVVDALSKDQRLTNSDGKLDRRTTDDDAALVRHQQVDGRVIDFDDLKNSADTPGTQMHAVASFRLALPVAGHSNLVSVEMEESTLDRAQAGHLQPNS